MASRGGLILYRYLLKFLRADIALRNKMPVANSKISAKGGSVFGGQISNSNSGFTLMELMVVVAIMVILATVLVLNLAGQRAKRDVTIAANQLVTDLRQAQSNTLSARRLADNSAPQYYLVRFNLATPTQYSVLAMYNVSNPPQQLQQVQTVTLPSDVRIAAISASMAPIQIFRSGGIFPSTQNIPGDDTCALVAFAAPFGKTILNAGCQPASTPAIYNIQSNDDYEKIINFISNTSCDSNNYPFGCTASSDSTMTITLSDTGHTVSRTVLVNGETGSVCPTQDNTTCLASY